MAWRSGSAKLATARPTPLVVPISVFGPVQTLQKDQKGRLNRWCPNPSCIRSHLERVHSTRSELLRHRLRPELLRAAQLHSMSVRIASLRLPHEAFLPSNREPIHPRLAGVVDEEPVVHLESSTGRRSVLRVFKRMRVAKATVESKWIHQ